MTNNEQLDQRDLVPDSEVTGMMALLPKTARPYALLARFDRPIGWWLLFWPSAWGMALAGGAIARWDLLLWMLLGSIAMRGAGCVYNDIVDRDLDKEVERTRNRPLASGAVSMRNAWMWLLFLCAIGLLVLFQLVIGAQIVAVVSVALVAAYPFMKRITWWPQLWLGLVFSWGALVGWVAVKGQIEAPILFLYAGAMLWVVGYDTIYAMQDREDDALVGIKSSALRLGQNVKPGVFAMYMGALVLWGFAFWLMRPQLLALVALIPMAAHLFWQSASLQIENGDDALVKFRSNRFAGLLMFLACLVLGQAG